MRILRPALMNTVGGVVALVAAGVYGVTHLDWATDGPAIERRGLWAGVLLLVAAGWGVWSWRRQRGVLARGLAGVAEVLEVKETGSDGGLVNLALLLRVTDVAGQLRRQVMTYVYQTFSGPRCPRSCDTMPS